MIGSCVAVSILHSITGDSLVAMTITFIVLRAVIGTRQTLECTFGLGRYLGGTTTNPFPDRIPDLLLEC